jgi:hypothetical protein
MLMAKRGQGAVEELASLGLAWRLEERRLIDPTLGVEHLPERPLTHQAEGVGGGAARAKRVRVRRAAGGLQALGQLVHSHLSPFTRL